MLQQTAARADAHGVFSGNCPSGGGIADYALIWFEALRVYLAATGDAPACKVGLYPIVTFQYSLTTLYQFYYHIR
jgi:hypothetical protein